MQGSESIQIGEAAIKHLQVSPKQVILHFRHLLGSNSYRVDCMDAYRNREVAELVRREGQDPISVCCYLLSCEV